MSKTNWDDLLCRFGCVRFSKSNDDDTSAEAIESDDEEYTSFEANESILTKPQ